jgi:recombinase/recombinase-like zinc beta ribbon protein
VFTEFTRGVAQRKIARRLARDGVKTTRGGAWAQPQVSAVLHSRLYIGEVTYKGEWFPGEHDPIVSQDLFEAAQQLLGGAPASSGGRPSHEPFLLAGGFLKCGCCGSTMRTRSRRSGKRVGTTWSAFYRCMGRDRGSCPDCTMPAVTRNDIDNAVFSYFERAAVDHEATATAFDQRFAQERAIVHGQVEQAEEDQTKALGRLERVRGDYQNGKLAADDWREQRGQLTGELEAAEHAAELLRKRERALAAEAEEVRTEQKRQGLDALATFRAAVAADVTDAASVEAARVALRSVFRYFVIHREPFTQKPSFDAEDELRFRKVVDADLFFDGYYLEPVPRDDAIVVRWKLSDVGDVQQIQELRRVGIHPAKPPELP